jgi:uncharacterized tellurite resistance protein B-like protein
MTGPGRRFEYGWITGGPSMLSSIRRFFDELIIADSSDETDPQHSVQCAAAALLLEMAHLDEVLKPEEQDAVLSAVRKGST